MEEPDGDEDHDGPDDSDEGVAGAVEESAAAAEEADQMIWV